MASVVYSSEALAAGKSIGKGKRGGKTSPLKTGEPGGKGKTVDKDKVVKAAVDRVSAACQRGPATLSSERTSFREMVWIPMWKIAGMMPPSFSPWRD